MCFIAKEIYWVLCFKREKQNCITDFKTRSITLNSSEEIKEMFASDDVKCSAMAVYERRPCCSSRKYCREPANDQNS